MKIAILSYWYSPYRVAGSELAVYSYAKALAQKGHEIHVITRLDNKKLPSYELTEGFHVHRLRRGSVRIVSTVLYFLFVCRKIRELEPEIVHEQAIQGLGLFVKKLTGIPCIIFPRGVDLYLASSFYRKSLVKLALKNADAVLGQTQDMVREIGKFCHREVTVIPNGVDTTRFRISSRKDARQKLEIKEQERLILCVAHLRAEKGHEYLIKAMEEVVINCPESRLFLVGQDFLKGKIQALVPNGNLQQKIVFTGFVPPPGIPDYMAAADIFVLPSLGEGFPNVLLEAMAAGLPVVATDVGGVPEIINNGENGLLVKPKDPKQLAEKILFLLQNDDIRKRLSDNNLRKAKDCDWSAIVTSLEEIYLRVRKR